MITTEKTPEQKFAAAIEAITETRPAQTRFDWLVAQLTEHRQSIQRALDGGCTWKQIVAILKENGEPVSPALLKRAWETVATRSGPKPPAARKQRSARPATGAPTARAQKAQKVVTNSSDEIE